MVLWFCANVQNFIETSGEYADTGFEHAVGSAYGMMGATIELGLRRGRETWKLVLDNYPISG